MLGNDIYDLDWWFYVIWNRFLALNRQIFHLRSWKMLRIIINRMSLLQEILLTISLFQNLSFSCEATVLCPSKGFPHSLTLSDRYLILGWQLDMANWGDKGHGQYWTLNVLQATNKFPQNLSFLAHDKISFMYMENDQIREREWGCDTLSFEENPSLDLNFNILLLYCELWRWELLVFWSVFPRQLSSYRRIRLPDAWGRGGILDRELWIVSLSQKQTFAKFEVLQSQRPY